LKLTSVNFVDVTTKTRGTKTVVAPATSGVSADASLAITSESATATGAGNGVGAQDGLLVGLSVF
jgi:hypothetical protein